MLHIVSRMRLTVGVCLVFLGGCAGVGSEPLVFWPKDKFARTVESPVLNSQQTADVHLALGRTAEQQKDWSAAMTVYRQLLDADPKHPEATHRLAILHDRQGEFEQSSQLFQKALKLKPGDSDLFCDVGFSLYSQGRYSDAETKLRQAITMKPDHARAHNILGLVLAQQGEGDAAFAAFRRANCSPAQAHTNLAVILALNNQAEDARTHLQSAHRHLEPDDRGIHQRLEEFEVLIADRQSQQFPPPGRAEMVSTVLP